MKTSWLRGCATKALCLMTLYWNIDASSVNHSTCLKPACPWVWAPCLLPPLIKLEWNYLFLLWEPNIERTTFNKKIPFGIQNYIQGALKCLFRFHGVNTDEIRNWHLEPVTRPWSFMDRPLGYKSWSISWSQLFCIQKRYVYLSFGYLNKPITKVIHLCQKPRELTLGH